MGVRPAKYATLKRAATKTDLRKACETSMRSKFQATHRVLISLNLAIRICVRLVAFHHRDIRGAKSTGDQHMLEVRRDPIRRRLSLFLL